MNARALAMKVAHYSTLIQCFLRMEAPNKALRIFSEMKAHQIRMNHTAFIQMCSAQCRLLRQQLARHDADIDAAEKYYSALLGLHGQKHRDAELIFVVISAKWAEPFDVFPVESERPSVRMC